MEKKLSKILVSVSEPLVLRGKFFFVTKNFRTLVSIVTFNSEQTIVPCIESVLSQSGLSDLQLVITDNASSDNTVPLIREEFGEQVSINSLTENTGFCRAHNRALEAFFRENGDFALILNPDVILETNCLSLLLESLEVDTRAGLCSPKLFRADESLQAVEPRRFDSTGMFITRNCRHFDRGSDELDRGQYERPEYLFGVTGAAMLLRRTCYFDLCEEKEFFDESFFAYREDADVSWRAQWLGWRCRYEPRAIGYHQRQVLPSDRYKLPPTLNRLGVQNRFLLQLRNFSLFANAGCIVSTLLRNMLVILGVLLVEQTSLPAFAAIIRGFPKAFKRRRKTLSKRRVSHYALSRWFRTSPVAEPALSQVPAKKQLKHILAVIVNFNSGERLKACIQSLKTGEGARRLHILIMDNNSSDESVSLAKEEFSGVPDISFVESSSNRGFSGAINEAAKHHSSDALLVLNPDVEVTRANMRELFRALDAHDNLGAIGPVLYGKNEKLQRDFVARRFRSPLATIAELFYLHRLWPSNPFTKALHQTDSKFVSDYLEGVPGKEDVAPFFDLSQPMVVEQPPAACILIRRDAFDEIGGFDEEFWPAWFEDVDFCKRLFDAGWCSAITRKSRATHEGGYSLNVLDKSDFAIAWYANLALYHRKTLGFTSFLLLVAALRAALLLRGCIACCIKNSRLGYTLLLLSIQPLSRWKDALEKN